jgi:hypothetical protein
MKTIIFTAKITPSNRMMWPKGIAERCIKASKKMSTIIPNALPFVLFPIVKIVITNHSENGKEIEKTKKKLDDIFGLDFTFTKPTK